MHHIGYFIILDGQNIKTFIFKIFHFCAAEAEKLHE